AWDGLKAMSYGSGQSLSVGYTNRLQTQSWTITGSLNQVLQNPAGKQIEHQYYADGRQKYSHDLLANQFDRASAYDQVGALKEAYTGSEARDFVNNSNSGSPSGPFRQTYQHDAFGNMTSRVNRYWSQSDTYSASYDSSNRNIQWQYDANGN